MVQTLDQSILIPGCEVTKQEKCQGGWILLQGYCMSGLQRLDQLNCPFSHLRTQSVSNRFTTAQNPFEQASKSNVYHFPQENAVCNIIFHHWTQYEINLNNNKIVFQPSEFSVSNQWFWVSSVHSWVPWLWVTVTIKRHHLWSAVSVSHHGNTKKMDGILSQGLYTLEKAGKIMEKYLVRNKGMNIPIVKSPFFFVFLFCTFILQLMRAD